jgi:phosphate transport system substrate-binding protein
MKRGWIVAAALVAGLVTALRSGPSVSDAKPAGHRIVKGSVVTENSQPLGKVRIRCLDSSGKTEDKVKFADTDQTGRFALEIPIDQAQFKLSFVHLANAYWPREMDFTFKTNPYDVGAITLRPQSERPSQREEMQIRAAVQNLRPTDSFMAELINYHLTNQAVVVNGAGTSLPYPLYAKWSGEYQRIHPDSKIIYTSVGSGAGIKQITEGTVDFGASDTTMSDAQLAAFYDKRGAHILHFPTAISAVVPICNLQGGCESLTFSPEILAGIYLGKITKWNDPRILAANKNLRLPEKDIVVVHRADGGGTTYVWTEYLSKISAEWNERVGKDTSVGWPVGQGAKGDEGVYGLVQQTLYSIGYIRLAFATANHIPYAAVQNASGAVVKADSRTVGAAAESLSETIPDDFRVSITNAPGKDAYPISAFTYLLVPYRSNNAQTIALADFLNWTLVEGQGAPAQLGYVPLPPSISDRLEQKIRSIKWSQNGYSSQ